MKKKILIALLFIFIIIQFIRPAKNQSSEIAADDISKHFTVPQNVQMILQRSCNDCHSNNTHYPWYSNIQPVYWWLQKHINDGKKELNFSTFASYTPKRQVHKLNETIEQIKSGEMPLNSYLWIHHDAKLNTTDQKALTDWATTLKNEIATANQLPADK